jgi:ATP-dependent Clp protease ATP-binding subunit ClpA
MQVNVNIDPDEINRQVTAAIVDSALGQKLKAAIEARLNVVLGGGYQSDSVIGQVVDEEVRAVVRRLLTTTYRVQVEEAAKTYMAERFTDELLTRAFDKLWDKLL